MTRSTARDRNRVWGESRCSRLIGGDLRTPIQSTTCAKDLIETAWPDRRGKTWPHTRAHEARTPHSRLAVASHVRPRGNVRVHLAVRGSADRRRLPPRRKRQTGPAQVRHARISARHRHPELSLVERMPLPATLRAPSPHLHRCTRAGKRPYALQATLSSFLRAQRGRGGMRAWRMTEATDASSRSPQRPAPRPRSEHNTRRFQLTSGRPRARERPRAPS